MQQLVKQSVIHSHYIVSVVLLYRYMSLFVQSVLCSFLEQHVLTFLNMHNYSPFTVNFVFQVRLQSFYSQLVCSRYNYSHFTVMFQSNRCVLATVHSQSCTLFHSHYIFLYRLSPLFHSHYIFLYSLISLFHSHYIFLYRLSTLFHSHYIFLYSLITLFHSHYIFLYRLSTLFHSHYIFLYRSSALFHSHYVFLYRSSTLFHTFYLLVQVFSVGVSLALHPPFLLSVPIWDINVVISGLRCKVGTYNDYEMTLKVHKMTIK